MNTPHRMPHLPARSRQRGTVLLFALISVVIVLISAVALIRSFNSSLFMAGNIAFKRDLQNQSERAISDALTEFRTSGGALRTRGQRSNNVATANYSASVLPVNNQGVPTALQSTSAMTAAGFTKPDTDASVDASLSGMSVKYRYVIDRLCNSAGDETATNISCMLSTTPPPSGTSSSQLQGAGQRALCSSCNSALPQSVVYRVSVRVEGPRNTVSFFQSTITDPS